MPDQSVFDALRIPSDILLSLDNRVYHFALQPYHFIVRLMHVLSMAAFLGGVIVLDLQLMRVGPRVPLKVFADFILPYLYFTFAVSMISGVMLFFYDPLHVGAHAYFVPKLILIFLALGNAAFFNLHHMRRGMHISQSTVWLSRFAAAVSLSMWIGVVICACMNVEGVPKVYLQG